MTDELGGSSSGRAGAATPVEPEVVTCYTCGFQAIKGSPEYLAHQDMGDEHTSWREPQPRMKTFKIEVEFTETNTFTVRAYNEEDARKQVEEGDVEADANPDDSWNGSYDYGNMTIREVSGLDEETEASHNGDF
jgi:hypothetical protein